MRLLSCFFFPLDIACTISICSSRRFISSCQQRVNIVIQGCSVYVEWDLLLLSFNLLQAKEFLLFRSPFLLFILFLHCKSLR